MDNLSEPGEAEIVAPPSTSEDKERNRASWSSTSPLPSISSPSARSRAGSESSPLSNAPSLSSMPLSPIRSPYSPSGSGGGRVGGGGGYSPLAIASPSSTDAVDLNLGRILVRSAPFIKGFDINGIYDKIGEKEYQSIINSVVFKIVWNSRKSEWHIGTAAEADLIMCYSDASYTSPDYCVKSGILCQWHIKSEYLFCCSKWIPCPNIEVLDFEEIEAKRRRRGDAIAEKKRLKAQRMMEDDEKRDAMVQWMQTNTRGISYDKLTRIADVFCSSARRDAYCTIVKIASRVESKYDVGDKWMISLGLDTLSVNELISAMDKKGLLTPEFIHARSAYVEAKKKLKPRKDNDGFDVDEKNLNREREEGGGEGSGEAQSPEKADQRERVQKEHIDVKTFTEVLMKYLNSVDGVEGWLTRLVAPPQDFGPSIKKKEWFILYGNALYYFPEKPEDNKPLKIKYCTGYVLLHVNTRIAFKRDLDFGFDIIEPSCKTMSQEFCTESEYDKLFWQLTLKHFIARKHTSHDSIFRHDLSKKFLDSRSSRLLVNAESSPEFSKDFTRLVTLESSQSQSMDSNVYNVLGGLFNVRKWTERRISLGSTKESDYWLFFVGGRLICNQDIEEILAGTALKKFNIEDFTVEKVIDETDKLETLVLNVKSINLKQKYTSKGDCPYTIQNLVTVVSEMKNLENGQKRMKNLHIYDRFQEPKGETSTHILSSSIKSALQNHYFAKLFGDFSGSIKSFTKFMALPGDFIAKEHQLTDSIIILESGTVEVSKNNAPIGIIQGFFVFFDWTVFYSAAHLSSVRAITKCQIISIERKYFKDVIRKSVDATKQEKVDALKNVKLLENLSSDKIDRLSDLIFYKLYNDGEVIVKQGDPGNEFFMLKKGQVVVTKDEKVLTKLKSPSAFGEMALINNQPRSATIKAVGSVECYCIRKDGFLTNLGDLADAETESFGVKILKKIQLFGELSDAKLRTIARALEKRSYSVQEHIITQGEVGDCFYIIASGAVSVQINHIEITQLPSSSFFGEMALLNNEKRGATIVAATPVECLCLDKTNFNSILGSLVDKLRAQAEKRIEDNKKIKENSPSKAAAIFNFIRRSSSNIIDDSYDWCKMQPNCMLSNGNFSSILLATEKPSGKNFVLKIYGERAEKRHALTDQIEVEIKNQTSADSNFFVSLFNNTRIDGYIVLQMQYVRGENLSRLLYHHPKSLFGLESLISGGIPVKTAVFYVANVLYAIQYLHELDIVHRDLCLENILVDGSGNIKVCDFSCSRKVIESGRLYTICGKPEYLSPDMILMNGYTFSVDVWSLGIIFYELLTRRTPFQGNHQNDIILNIMTSPPLLDGIDETCKHFLSGALHKKQSLRLGLQRHGLLDIWRHPVIAGAGYTPETVCERSHVPPLTLDDRDLEKNEEPLGNLSLDFESSHDFVVFDKSSNSST